MNAAESGQVGYAFALPRLLARLAGRDVRRAELSRWEAYGFGILVFGMSCAWIARLILPFVRPAFLRVLVLLLIPFALWMAFLLVYFVNAQAVAVLRQLRLYQAPTNNPFQHFMIMTATTLIAFHFLGDERVWVKSLGVFWLGLLFCNLLALLILKLRHEP